MQFNTPFLDKILNVIICKVKNGKNNINVVFLRAIDATYCRLCVQLGSFCALRASNALDGYIHHLILF